MDCDAVQTFAVVSRSIEQVGESHLQTTTEYGVQWFDTCLEYLALGQFVCGLEGHLTRKWYDGRGPINCNKEGKNEFYINELLYIYDD
ncbi:MAG: hypothetical protein ACTSW8_08605 [Candidatus Thorarchaeota archaeon]